LSLPFPELGEPLPAQGEARLLDVLARRRSSPAQTLAAPGPSRAQVADLIRLGARVPDHGKLAPWRFVVIEAEPKARLVERLRALAAGRPDADQAAAKLAKLAAAPVSVLVVSRVTPGHKVPEWEQVLSAGAVCFGMLLAADAMGFGAAWITDWYAYDAGALKALGVGDDERVAGFIHLGTQPEPPLERARPDVDGLVSRWDG